MRRRPMMARPRQWWLACCKATAEVRGVLRRVRRSCGCTESLQGARSGWLAVGECQCGLIDPVARDYEIASLCTGIHRRVGMGRGQIPNEDEPKPNWSLMLRSRRIEKNCLGGQGDSGAGEVMAWLGSSAASTQRSNTPLRVTAGQAGRAPDGYPHGHCGKTTRRGMAPPRRAAPDK